MSIETIRARLASAAPCSRAERDNPTSMFSRTEVDLLLAVAEAAEGLPHELMHFALDWPEDLWKRIVRLRDASDALEAGT